MVIDTIELYILDTSQTALGLDSRSQACEKAKTTPIISHSFELIGIKAGILLRLVGLMDPMFVFFSSMQCSKERTYLCVFVKNYNNKNTKQTNFNVGLLSNVA